jgi:exosortase A
MLVKPPIAVEQAATTQSSRQGLIALVIVLTLLAPFLFYFGTAKSIVAIWDSSETFAHGYIILPISVWLIWRRRDNFRQMPPEPFWPALALLAIVGFGWLLARMGEVQVVMQYAFAAMIPVIALAMLGRRLAWSLAFPLLFVLLAVPFGEIFIDPLINFTADFTVRALQATGIPVLRNGTRFEIPTGSWSVVEACSGVRYLISSVTLGCLYAYLTYRSAARRAAFMLVAVLVPIVANGLRAYMIVMIGHLSGMKLAVGFDHLIYGWLFFGLVMFIMFWIGSFWREDEAAAPAVSGDTIRIASPASTARIATIALAVIATAAIWPLFAFYNDRVTANPQPVTLGSVAVTWPSAPAFSAWVPRYATPDASFSGVFQAPAAGAAGTGAGTLSGTGAGTTSVTPSAAPTSPAVGLAILYYRNQRNGKALISSTNRLVDEKDAIHQLRGAGRSESAGAGTLALREAELQGPSGNLLVWSWYWIDGQQTASNYGGKIMQAKAKLLFRGDDGAAILVSAPYAIDPEPARRAMRAFLAANLPAIDATLAAAKAH